MTSSKKKMPPKSVQRKLHPGLLMLAGALAGVGVIYATRQALASVYHAATEGEGVPALFGGPTQPMPPSSPQQPMPPATFGGGGMGPGGEGSSGSMNGGGFPSGSFGQRPPDGGGQPGGMPGGGGQPGGMPFNGEKFGGPGDNNRGPGNMGGGPNFGGQGQGQGPEGNRGGEGMNAEDQQRQDEERQKQDEERQKKEEEQQQKNEERRKAMEARGLESMKRGMKQAASGLASMKKFFDKATAKGAALPADCAEALSQAQAIINGIAKATTMEEAQELSPEDLGDNFQTLNECRMTMEKITRAQQMLKRIDTDIRSLERRWAKAKRSPTSEMQDLIKEGDGIVSSIKEKRASLNGLLKEGNIEDFEATLEDDVYGRFDDADSVARHLDAMRNASRFVKDYARRLREADQMIAKLKRMKRDTSKLEEILARAKEQYQNIKTLKPGSDEFDDALQEAFSLDQEFASEFGGDRDLGSELEAKSGGNNQGNFKLDLPNSLQ